MMGSIRLGIAEDFRPIRDAVIARLSESDDLSVLIAADHGKQLLEMLEFNMVDVVLMDIKMPVMDGFQTTSILRERFPQIKVIAFTQFDGYNNIVEMNKLGVKSFLLKENIDSLTRVIKIVNDGGIYFPDAIGSIIQSTLGSASVTKPTTSEFELSSLQLKILQLICTGFSSREIGELIHKSPRTVEDYRSTLYEKFHVVNKEQLISKAIALKIINT